MLIVGRDMIDATTEVLDIAWKQFIKETQMIRIRTQGRVAKYKYNLDESCQSNKTSEEIEHVQSHHKSYLPMLEERLKGQFGESVIENITTQLEHLNKVKDHH